MRALSSALLAMCVVVGCARDQPAVQAPNAPPARESELARAQAEAVTGVDDKKLAAILRDQWLWALEDGPIRATRLGVHAYDDKIADGSAAAIAARNDRRRGFLERLQAIDGGALSDRDALTKRLLERELGTALARRVCRFEQWGISYSNNPVTRYNDLPQTHPVTDAKSGADLVARYEAMPVQIDAELALLEQGAAAGLFANAESTRRALAMVDAQLDKPIESWPLFAPANKHPELEARIRQTLSEGLKPALQRYRDFVTAHVVPHARPPDRTGLTALALGQKCYAAVVEQHTTLPLRPQEVHDTGLAEIERLDVEIAALGRKLFGAPDLASTLARLRGDRDLYFATDAEIEAAARSALDLAKAKMPEFFGVLPKADCIVRRIADYKAPFTTIAYYDPAHVDGSKSGEYFVNVLHPAKRPRFEARVLAVHEAVPGHHLQIAIAQELGALPAFRRHVGYTAFVEGWALYTERLADEMGMYESDLDRMGMLSFDAWRAGRLVVDTGIHALGWSRDQAKRFLTAHTALSPANIDNEVDRYIVWPGQALGYKIGQLEIWALRRRAERELGAAFDLRAFHDAVLTAGAVPIPELRRRIEAHIRGRTDQMH